MKHLIFITFFLTVFLFLSCTEKKEDVSEDQLSGMRAIASEFMGQLKGVLITQIQNKGILQAVSVCSDTAQVLTNNFGTSKGVFIRRISFNNRNVSNTPDDFEKEILKKFELLQQNNQLNNETEYAEIVYEGEFKYLRYLKSILIQPECLNCHGSQSDIMPEVKNLISQKYPDDKAVNYKPGDLRGAVSLKKAIE